MQEEKHELSMTQKILIEEKMIEEVKRKGEKCVREEKEERKM